MGHETGDKQRPAKGRHAQGMLDETVPLNNQCAGRIFAASLCPMQHRLYFLRVQLYAIVLKAIGWLHSHAKHSLVYKANYQVDIVYT